MPIRKPKPTSAGRRFITYADFAEITKTEPERTLVEGLHKSGGRNANGRKTARHRGGGAKRLYRRVDFKRRKDACPRASRDRVRPQPVVVHRAAALRRTARRPTSSRRTGCASA
jgi:ribosomal protein L2